MDHNTRSVFNGSELGKAYSAAAIRESSKENRTQLAENAGTRTEVKTEKSIEVVPQPPNGHIIPGCKMKVFHGS